LSFAKGTQEGSNIGAIGSPAYAAPELPKESHTSKVDVFSFAVIMWEIYQQIRPWNDNETRYAWQITEKVARGDRLTLPSDGIFNNLITRCWDQSPDKRPTFVEIYEELEKIKNSIPVSQSSSSSSSLPITIPSPVPQLLPSIEEKLLNGFGSRPLIPWEEFVMICTKVINNATPSLLNRLKYVLGKNSMVDRNNFKMFLEWFFPLTQSSNSYQTDEGAVTGYDIDQIVDIVGPPWFFGFMTAPEAKEALNNKPYGSYLFRFSNNAAGSYALSVNYGQIGHWRIVAEKSTGYPIFRVDGRAYKSLYHIIETHTMGGEPLKVKGATASCYLKDYLAREVTEDGGSQSSVYQTMYT